MPHTDPLVRALAVTATGLMAAATLGACSDGEQSSGAAVSSGAEPPASSSPEPFMSGGYVVGPDGKLLKPTDAPIPVLPEAPASITENTPKAAEDFARYFVAVTEYAGNTGDTARMREISTDDCVLCNGMALAFEERYSSGGWNNGLSYRVTEVEEAVQYPDVPGKFAIVIHVTSSGKEKYDGESLSGMSPSAELIELHACFDRAWLACGGVGANDPQSG